MPESWPWYASRAAGCVAYALLTLTVISGTLTTTKPLPKRFRPSSMQDLHRVLSLVTFSFVGVHAAVLLFDHYIGYGLVNLVVPFTAAKDALAIGVGVIAFELGLVVAVSFRFRDRMGKRAWKLLHYASYPVWALALVHTLLVGTETGSVPALVAFVLSAAAVAAATGLRVAWQFAPQDGPRPGPRAGVGARAGRGAASASAASGRRSAE